MSRVIGNIRNILYNMHIRPKRASITPKRNRSSSGEKKFSLDRNKQSDKLVFGEYMLSLRASSQTGVAIPPMNGTKYDYHQKSQYFPSCRAIVDTFPL